MRASRHPRVLGPGPRAPGYTMVELMIALFLALLVALAAGAIVLTNQASFRRGREKIELQQETTRAVEQIARDVRRARWMAYDAGHPDELALLDADGTEFRVYELGEVDGVAHVLQNGAPLAEQECTALAFAINADTTAVDILLELQDPAENRVRVESTAAIRNRNFPGAAPP